MLEHLFGSKTRLKILRVLFRTQEKPFFVRELARTVETQINAVRRELEILKEIGLVKWESTMPKANVAEYGVSLRKYYRLNIDSVLFEPMRALLGKIQVLGEDALVEDIKKRGGKIKLFIITGHFTGDKRAPSDLLLVGAIKERSIAKIISDFEKDLGFSIRYTLMTEAEFKDRRHVMDKFLFSLFEAKNVKVVNELNV